MIHGEIEGFTTDGFVVGWAYDDARILDPTKIGVVDDEGRLVAQGTAHLFRDELADAALGTGWVGFHLQLATPPKRSAGPYTLFELEHRSALHVADGPDMHEGRGAITSIDELIATDPTKLQSVLQLRSCNHVFTRYIERCGVDDFLGAAFLYVLERPVDLIGHSTYKDLLESDGLTPFDVMCALYGSEERQRLRTRPASPPTLAFPFRSPAT